MFQEPPSDTNVQLKVETPVLEGCWRRQRKRRKWLLGLLIQVLGDSQFSCWGVGGFSCYDVEW